MSENPRRGRQARNFTTNVPKILDLKSSSEQIFFRKLSLGAPVTLLLTKISCPSCFQSEKSKALKSCSCKGGVVETGTSMSAEILGHLGEGLTALAFDLKFS